MLEVAAAADAAAGESREGDVCGDGGRRRRANMHLTRDLSTQSVARSLGAAQQDRMNLEPDLGLVS